MKKLEDMEIKYSKKDISTYIEKTNRETEMMKDLSPNKNTVTTNFSLFYTKLNQTVKGMLKNEKRGKKNSFEFTFSEKPNKNHLLSNTSLNYKENIVDTHEGIYELECYSTMFEKESEYPIYFYQREINSHQILPFILNSSNPTHYIQKNKEDLMRGLEITSKYPIFRIVLQSSPYSIDIENPTKLQKELIDYLKSGDTEIVEGKYPDLFEKNKKDKRGKLESVSENLINQTNDLSEMCIIQQQSYLINKPLPVKLFKLIEAEMYKNKIYELYSGSTSTFDRKSILESLEYDSQDESPVNILSPMQQMIVMNFISTTLNLTPCLVYQSHKTKDDNVYTATGTDDNQVRFNNTYVKNSKFDYGLYINEEATGCRPLFREEWGLYVYHGGRRRNISSNNSNTKLKQPTDIQDENKSPYHKKPYDKIVKQLMKIKNNNFTEETLDDICDTLKIKKYSKTVKTNLLDRMNKETLLYQYTRYIYKACQSQFPQQLIAETQSLFPVDTPLDESISNESGIQGLYQNNLEWTIDKISKISCENKTQVLEGFGYEIPDEHPQKSIDANPHLSYTN